MLFTLIFLVAVAVIANALGFTGIARGATTLAKVVVALFLIAIVLMILITLGVVPF